MTECERRDCDDLATKEVTYTDPAETVAYCDSCTKWATARFEFEGVRRL